MKPIIYKFPPQAMMIMTANGACFIPPKPVTAADIVERERDGRQCDPVLPASFTKASEED